MKKRNAIIVSLITLVLFVAGLFYDLPLSKAFYNQQNPFGYILAGLGETPALLINWLGIVLLFNSFDERDSKSKKAILIFIALLLTVLPTLTIKEVYKYLDNWLIWGIVEVIVCLVICYLVYKLTKNADKALLRKIAFIFMILPNCEIGVINIIKIIWARPRYRSIVAIDGLYFQDWWIISKTQKQIFVGNGILKSNEFKSMPSGHTANAFCLVALVLLPLISEKLKGKEDIFLINSVVYALIIAFSRIIMGAHFLTDVTSGLLVTLAVFLLMLKIASINRLE